MFGDFVLFVKSKWRQFWCIHEYKLHCVTRFHFYEECKKCGKLKKE